MSDGEEPQLDMTPMLDVVFILLIFFIVTAVFVKEPGADIIRPETVTQERVKPTLLVAVTANDQIFVDGDVYELNQLRNVFEQLREENPRAEAMIQGDEAAPAGTVLDVQELLLDMGIDVTISTRED
jgi:biopolymer transport protein ExbD